MVGTAYCVVSALAYTGANACLRSLADRVNPLWVICVKETVTVAVVGPWLAYLGLRQAAVWPSRQGLIGLAVVGLAVQLLGNLGMLWALGVVGLSITIPAVLGVNLAGSAVLGWVFLKERVTRRTIAAIAMLILAVVLLKIGAGQVNHWVAQDPLRVALALGACATAGLVFAAMAVAIRKTVTGHVPPAVVVFVITGMGTLSLGPLSVWRLGIPALAATPKGSIGLMLAAGLLNLIGFFTITRGLQFATVVRANVLNASQVAMAAIVGMVVFGEAPAATLVAGICLTIIGMVLIERPPAGSDAGEGDLSPQKSAL